MATRGFTGRRTPAETARRLPPGQHLTEDFPVLSFGPTPTVDMATWRFTLKNGSALLAAFSWDELNALPQTEWHRDIHCVTTWSKFDTSWRGVTVDDLLASAGITAPTPYVLASSYDDYTTNVPLSHLTGGQAMIATHFDGRPLPAEHGGPARLLVPHLYFWKSAKWVNGLKFTARDEAGFWELRGYHMLGEPFKQQRYSDD